MRQIKFSECFALMLVFFLAPVFTNSTLFHGIMLPDALKDIAVKSIEPIVNVSQGTLQGTADLSRDGRLFLSFKGIPFGKVVKRFEIAEPADNWKGTFKATEYGEKCSQIGILKREYVGTEQCLTLNVFVPMTKNPDMSLPVMVFIHGGGFVIGETSVYKPTYFMDEDVILVTISYRLGPFGFLDAGVKGASGNQGLKDLVLGLKWVKENIAQFGGDSAKIGIFGESAGGSAVSALVASPMAKGLFSSAIAQSGVAMMPLSVYPDPEHKEAKKLAVAVDCPTSNKEFMVECLRKIDAGVLAKAVGSKYPLGFDRTNVVVTSPTVETYKESENDPNVFLSENVENIYREGRFNKVPILAGYTSHEGYLLSAIPVVTNPNATKALNEQWGKFAPQAFYYWSTAKDPCVISSKLRAAYLNGKPVGIETLEELQNLFGDIKFKYPTRTIGILAAEHVPVYFYNFTRLGRSSTTDIYGWKPAVPSLKPPTHGDDLSYAFEIQAFGVSKKIDRDSPDYKFSKNLVKFWTSFAQTGKPSHSWGSEEAKTLNVHPVNATDAKHSWLTIDNQLGYVAEDDEFLQRMSIIEDIRKNDIELPVYK